MFVMHSAQRGPDAEIGVCIQSLSDVIDKFIPVCMYMTKKQKKSLNVYASRDIKMVVFSFLFVGGT